MSFHVGAGIVSAWRLIQSLKERKGGEVVVMEEGERRTGGLEGSVKALASLPPSLPPLLPSLPPTLPPSPPPSLLSFSLSPPLPPGSMSQLDTLEKVQLWGERERESFIRTGPVKTRCFDALLKPLDRCLLDVTVFIT